MNTPDAEPNPNHSGGSSHVLPRVVVSDDGRAYVAGRDVYVHTGAGPDDGPDAVRGSGRALARMVAPFLLLLTGVALVGGAAYVAGGWTARGTLLLAGVAPIATAVPMLRPGLHRWRQARLRRSPRRARRLERQLDGAAKQLADELREEWQREERLRGTHHPSPLPVRWVNEEGLTDHWSSILGAGAGEEPLDLSGRIGAITEVYAKVPSGRLIVLGDAGSGKSVLALRFAVERLRRVAPADPVVPVLLPLASWDPATRDLKSWAAERLVDDHPALAALTVSGDRVAVELLRTGRLLPVLDGFDEIRPDARAEALCRLRAGFGRADRFLLTSRVDEYEAAVEEADALLPATAAVRLEPLDLEELADHLRRTARKGVGGSEASTKWDPVFARLRANGDGVQEQALRSVLSTPLMTGLARTAYSESALDPAELLDAGRFPTREAIEDHLLDRLVPAVVGRPERSTRWLAFLARQLDSQGTQELAWWRLNPRAAEKARALGWAAALGAATAVMWWLFDQRKSLAGVELPVWVWFGLLCLVSVADLTLASRGTEPSPRYFRRPESVPRFLLGAAVALVAALLWFRVMEYPLLLVLFCCAFALSALLHPGLKTTTAGGSPAQVLNRDRLATLTSLGLVNILTGGGAVLRAAGLVLFPMAALAQWEANGGHESVGHLEWAVTGGVSAAALAATGVSMSAWAAYTAARVRPWAYGRIPWKLVEFLDDAHRLGVLRQFGATYRFRHARLQDRLAGAADQRAPGSAPAGAGAGAGHPWAGPAVRPVARAATMLVLVLGAGAVWTGIESLPDPALLGRVRESIAPACELLDEQDLSALVPDARGRGDEGSASHLDSSTCWWSEGTPSAAAPNVMLTSRLHRPVFGRSAAETADRYLRLEDDSAVALPQSTAHPAGLGDKAVTVVKFPGPHPLVETTVRVDNVVFTVGYDVNVAREDDRTYGRLAAITQDLARIVVAKLG
ncbi:NACHT domain-containing protein [Streptomyces sp. ISL-43]|uniref:NACHT domain-containing protein n=1 Tax=Streptomyces sp. ISL-43 TaxID=2819183 RepID=UPI001BE94BC7|nr:NACHT domain-containing protein [Streptomyces sp. ISL-43]MBT2450986.1 NACHT domain-containing protein [Streptomyces sp. ISL-43]